MKCRCNPSRAEFGDWRGVRRCAICGKIFHTGWKCRPRCETIIIEDCPGEDTELVWEECQPKCELADTEGRSCEELETAQQEYSVSETEENQTECEPDDMEDCDNSTHEEQASEPPPDETDTHQEEKSAIGDEWTPLLSSECREETGDEQLWPLDELTNQLPPAPH